MRLRLKIVLFLGMYLLVGSACDRIPAATDGSCEISFYPGECLSNNTLLSNFAINDYISPLAFVFSFRCDMEETTEREIIPSDAKYKDYRYVPSGSLFNRYGVNADLVRQKYEDSYKSVRYGHDNLRITSIFYEGGMEMTADKEFAGHPAGENLIPYCYLWEITYSKEYYQIPVGRSDSYGNPINKSFAVCYPIGDRKIVDKTVTFTLSIPVKVGMYLTWLNDSLEDLDATMSYSDEVLNCTFTIDKKI